MMRLCEYQAELFPEDPVPTEFFAYQMLKAKPLKSPVNYLAVPWAVLMNKRKLESLPEIRVEGGFTICQHLKYNTILPLLKKMGIDTLFCPHVSENESEGIRLLPFPHYAVNGAEPAKLKDLFYTFAGIDSTATANSDLRRKIFSMKHPSGTVVIERKSWHWMRENGWGEFPADEQLRERREYQDLLSRSEFSLCPRGFGASTIRFWESLRAGAVPVLLSDSLKLPPDVNWDECVVRVPEKEVLRVAEILSAVSKKERSEMSRKCLEAYQCFSGARFVSVIRAAYHEAV